MTSKFYLHHQFEDSRIESRSDGAEGRRTETAVGISQRRCVESVEDLGSKVGAHPLAVYEGFGQHQIGGAIWRPGYRIARAVADRKLRGLAEGICVEPAAHALPVGRQGGIRIEVRPLDAEAGE